MCILGCAGRKPSAAPGWARAATSGGEGKFSGATAVWPDARGGGKEPQDIRSLGGEGGDCVAHDSFLKKGKSPLPGKAGKDAPSSGRTVSGRAALSEDWAWRSFHFKRGMRRERMYENYGVVRLIFA